MIHSGMPDRALKALAIYRTHKRCYCEHCTYARDVLAAMDRERTIGTAPRLDSQGGRKERHRCGL